jgi:AraC family transcriptional regulator, positive regulator of tynA and feaB
MGNPVNTSNAVPPSGIEQLNFAHLNTWREVVCHNLIGIEVAAPEPARFRGSFTQFSFGQASLASVAATPIRGCRPASLISPTLDDGLLINMVVSGFGHTAQHGRGFEIQPGDLFLQDMRAPYSIDMATDFNLITVRSPRRLVEHYLPISDELSAAALSRDPGMARIAASLLVSLAANAAELSPEDRELALAHLLTTLGIACTGADSHHPRTAQQTTFSRVSRFIDTHLRQPALSSSLIAKACGITTRHLSRMFEDRADTVSRTILRRRLERCRLDLLSRSLSNRSISEIAYYWGFNNLSHFSETFRHAYGISPRELRRRSSFGKATET